MVEVWAAVAGASITVAGVGVSGLSRQSRQGQDSLIRLTAAVDNLAGRLDILHNDIKTKDMEVFARLNELERSVAMLLLIRPILFRFLQSKGVKILVIDLLTAYCKSTDNTVDDKLVEFVSQNLFPTTRVEK